MKNQIRWEINNVRSQGTFFSLMMFDIEKFSNFNCRYGYEHGNTLLREVAQLITMNVRDVDLICRYASDRFIVLMPNTDKQTADEIAKQTKKSIEHLAYKSDNTSRAFYPSIITCNHQYRTWHSYEEVLIDINQHLSSAKQPSCQGGGNKALSA